MRHSMKMLAKDSRSQDGKDDKDNDKGSKSRSQSMKEQTYNKEQRERPIPHELNDKSNLTDLMKEFSVHKLVKENKVIVSFDENICYFLNQDLNLKNVLGIGEQCEGLLGHPADPVLNVLKDSLNFDKRDNTGYYEVCQMAKQTREPFPLSDHKSKNLGDLVHLDLCGPYKVTSSKGFRFFLTVVDDYTRAVWVYLIKSKDEFMHSPLTSHLKIAFKILRYLKRCPGLGVYITKTSGMFLTAYSDADCAKCVVTRKSVIGYCVFLNNSLVSWKSKKQNTVSISSTEAVYRALALVTSEVI
ncbi:ribonuclease H-like domain-containing protein [Tanacetum coccineum]